MKPHQKPWVFKLQADGRVDGRLREIRTTADVWWSPSWTAPPSHGGRGGCNSYVLVETSSDAKPWWEPPFLLDGRPVYIACINGQGEIRWRVQIRDVTFYVDQLEKAGGNLELWDWPDQREAYCAFKHFQQGGLKGPDLQLR